MELMTSLAQMVWLPLIASGVVTALWAAGSHRWSNWQRVFVGALPVVFLLSFLLSERAMWVPVSLRWGGLGVAAATVLFLARREERRAALGGVGFLVLAGLLAYFSGGKGGPNPFVALFENVVGLNHADALTATLITRKVIHFTTYGLFAWLAVVAWRPSLRAPKLWFWFGMASSAVFAGFDEVRQLGYSNRTGSFWDFLLDMAGAVTFLLVSEKLARPRETSG